MTFRSTAVEALGGGRYRVHGEITIRDETHSTVFEVETSPLLIDAWGHRRAGATATGTFSRKEWGLAWVGRRLPRIRRRTFASFPSILTTRRGSMRR